MGVITVNTPMNSSHNVPYTHKKFKRVVSDTVQGCTEHPGPEAIWPSHNSTPSLQNPIESELSSPSLVCLDDKTTDDKCQCTFCGVRYLKPATLQKHMQLHTSLRSYNCGICQKDLKTKSNYSKHVNSRAHIKKLCKGKTAPEILELPNETISLTQENNFSDCIQQAHVKNPTGQSGNLDIFPDSHNSKYIYKPKFRLTCPAIGEDHTQFHNHETTHELPSEHSIVSASSFNAVHTISQNTIERDSVRSHDHNVSSEVIEDVNKWKGINSPSPEDIGIHITKLIVENQAIVETHNPLWSKRYRRQSSLGSSSSESDSSLHGKNRFVSLTDTKILDHNHLPDVPAEQPDILSPSNTRLTVISSRDTLHSRISVASRIDTEPSFHNARSVLHSSLSHKNVNKLGPNSGTNRAEEFAFTTANSENRFLCTHCQVYFNDATTWQDHMRLHCVHSCNSLSSETEENLKTWTGVQCEALNLENKTKTPKSEAHYISNRNILVSPQKRNFRPDTSLFPNKRTKVSDECSFIPYSNVNQKYVNILETSIKPGNVLCGGEVEICDGNERKTLRIDTGQNQESPAYDINISPHNEIIPTSLIMMIAKSGLNCGGTVQLDTKELFKSSSTAEIYHRNKGCHSKEEEYECPLLAYPVLQLPNLTIPGVLVPQLSILSLPSMQNNKGSGSSAMFALPPNVPKSSSEDSLRNNSGNSDAKTDILKVKSVICEPESEISAKSIIPFVPGMPGPYSQSGQGTLVSIARLARQPSRLSIPSARVTIEKNQNPSQEKKNTSMLSTESVKCVRSAGKYENVTYATSRSSRRHEINKSMEVKTVFDGTGESDKQNSELTVLSSSDLRKRPNYLPLIPHTSSRSLIGTTLVSPDTPRPKKASAQMFLNGSAYSYLGHKVSTKSFYCCIYRPQPMYVPQTSNPKLSMYSNWQTRKAANDDSLKLAPYQELGLYVSGRHHDQTCLYTMAVPTTVQLTETKSSYWKEKHGGINNSTLAHCEVPIKVDPQPETLTCDESMLKSALLHDNKRTNTAVDLPSSKRIRIFEGGYKTTEEYTYIRGRGRGRYVCETCGIRCKKPSMLKKHIRTHTDFRPYACVHCSFSFKTKGNMTKHLRSKAHYKRCVEMGVVPVPVIFDDSHVNTQGFLLNETNRLETSEHEDGDTDEEDEDEESDDDEEDLEEDDEDMKEEYVNLKAEDEDQGSLRNNVMDAPVDLSMKKTVSEDSIRFGGLKILDQLSFGCVLSENVEHIPISSSSHQVGIEECSSKIFMTLPDEFLLKGNCDIAASNSVEGEMLVENIRRLGHNNQTDHSSGKQSDVLTDNSIRVRCEKILSGNSKLDSHECKDKNPTLHDIHEKYDSGMAAVTSSIELKNYSELTTVESQNILSLPTSVITSLNQFVSLKSPLEISANISVSKNVDMCLGSASRCIISNADSMPTRPMNMTVLNNGGLEAKAAFLAPSGVLPSQMSGRLSRDDGKCRCHLCHKEFSRPSQLTMHMNVHYLERPFRCESCAISFRTNGHLLKHRRSVTHFNKMNMNMAFGTPSSTNPRPFKCHDCKIAFRIHGHLAKHLRSKMHIMKLECVGKLPFGIYAEIERSGANLNDIDTTDCENSLESLQVMAVRLYDNDPSKLSEWRREQSEGRQRTDSNSSTNSEDFPLQDYQEKNDDQEEKQPIEDDDIDDDEGETVLCHEKETALMNTVKDGLDGTAGFIACVDCHEKFTDAALVQLHHCSAMQADESLQCRSCDCKFSNRSQLATHRLSHRLYT